MSFLICADNILIKRKGTGNMENNDNKNEEKNEDIKEFGSSEIRSERGSIHCLTIIGQIEGHIVLSPQNKTTKYEHLLPQLVAIEENDDIDGVLILLNTMGGDVEAGLAISEMIATMKKPTVSLVLGGGHSIGVPLAVSAKHSYIARSATMTIHPIRMNGMIIGAPQTFDYLTKMQDRIVDFVTRNSEVSEENFLNLMMNTENIANDVGTILFGKEAVEYGIINSVGGLEDAIETLYKMIEERRDNVDKDELK